jgi:glutamate/tyrosine decarboxylase-like PLP-dependent enzyme
MIRHLGRQGIAAMVNGHCRMARQMAETLSREPGVGIRNDVVLNQVVVRFGADESVDTGDDLTLRTIRRIQADGICFTAGARWRGEWVMRVSVISAATTEADADRATAAIVAAWRSVRDERLPTAA